MAKDEYEVIDRTYELIKWFLGHITRFPRSHRYTLGERIELKLYDVLDRLLRARYCERAQRGGELTEANLQLQTLRFMTRLSFELKLLPTNSYGHAAKELEEIGRMIGGWQRSLSKTP